MIREFLLLISWPAAGIALASSLYTAGLTASAAVARLRKRPPAPSAKPSSRFAILVPAHNEETVIERLLQSLRDLDYPADLLDIYVIADNCEDDTEALARAACWPAMDTTGHARAGRPSHESPIAALTHTHTHTHTQAGRQAGNPEHT